MKQFIIAAFFALFASVSPVCAQPGLLFIAPDSLIQNADAIVRKYDAKFAKKDINSGEYTKTVVITVLNSNTKELAYFNFWGDEGFEELVQFSGTVRNFLGEKIKDIKKSDLRRDNFDNSAFKSNACHLSYEYVSPAYPFTIEYNTKVKYKNGIIAYPSFIPLTSYNVSVENATCTLELPLKDLRYKCINVPEPIITETKTGCTYTFSVSGIKAVKYEPLLPHPLDYLPHALLAPANFCFDSSCGDMTTWNETGKWQNRLLEGRDLLPADLTAHLNTLVDGAANDREKVKRIYEYLQQNTRYVSIQLGIGGFQPEKAEKVCKDKFGDCKGLTNLMKAMLKTAGIESNYCIVRMGGKKSFFPDYSSINQANHVVLCVPLSNDTLWLECTSQDLPFGYIHRNIAGHNALLVSESGGELVTIPACPDSLNLETSSLTVDLMPDGSAEGQLEFAEYQYSYEHYYSKLHSTDRNELVSFFSARLQAQHVEYGTVNITEMRDKYPCFKVQTSFRAKNMAGKTGNRLFLPACLINKTDYSFYNTSARNGDIYRGEGFIEIDTLIYKLPLDYEPENLPKDILIENLFGRFTSSAVYNQQTRQIVYIQTIEMHAGTFPQTLYPQGKELFVQISSALKRKIVIKKRSLS